MGRKKKNSSLAIIIVIIFAIAFFSINIMDPKLTTTILNTLNDKTNSVDNNSNNVSELEFSTENINIYFCPEQDCKNIFINEIKSAKKSIDCALYDVDSREIGNAFLLAMNSNKKVRLFSDDERGDNSETARILNRANILKFDNRSALMHNKFCIFDNKKIWVGSMNTTDRGTEKNNNNAMLIKSEELSKIYQEEFNELWNGVSGKKSPKTVEQSGKIQAYFCPEDSCYEKLEKVWDESEKSIHCMFFALTLDASGDKLIEKNETVDVKMIFEKTQTGSKYSEYNKLKENNVRVLLDDNKYNMHNKICIIDEKIVFGGSMNPSNNSDNRNDESIIFIQDEKIAEIYENYFQKYWEEWKKSE